MTTQQLIEKEIAKTDLEKEPQEPDWSMEFDKQFRIGEKAWHPNFVMIKDFIRNLLAQTKSQTIDSVLEVVEEMSVNVPNPKSREGQKSSLSQGLSYIKHEGFNQALSDVKEGVEKLREGEE